MLGKKDVKGQIITAMEFVYKETENEFKKSLIPTDKNNKFKIHKMNIGLGLGFH